MNLANFEKHFSKKILERGEQYYAHGHVLDIDKIDERTFLVEVEGSDMIYEVWITLSSSDEIVDTTCNCPFDYDWFCKHQAAALLELREEQKSSKRFSSKNTFEQALNNASKKQLQQFIQEIVLEFPHVKKKFIYQFEEDNQLLKKSELLIKESIQEMKKQGFIERKNVTKAVRGLEQVAEKATRKQEDGQYQLSIKLNELIITYAIDMYNYADDSIGIIGDYLYRSIDRITEVAEQVSSEENEEEQLATFYLIYDHCLKTYFNGNWEKERNELLEAACYFAHLPEAYQKLNDLIDEKVLKAKFHYERAQVLQVKLSFLKSTATEESIHSFLYKNRDIPELRSQLIETKMAEGSYTDVIMLCEEGLKGDIVKKAWQKYLVTAYIQLEQWQEARELLETQVFKGDFPAYQQLKELYEAEEWLEKRNYIFDQFEENEDDFNVYTQALIEENLPNRMLTFSEQSPSKILQFYPILVEAYPEEVDQLFSRLIYTRSETVNERKGYKEVCQLIKQYRNICGKKASMQMVADLKVLHKKRPAFLDELGKIK